MLENAPQLGCYIYTPLAELEQNVLLGNIAVKRGVCVCVCVCVCVHRVPMKYAVHENHARQIRWP